MKKRLTPEELDARLKFVVGCVLAAVLTITTCRSFVRPCICHSADRCTG
jgi:hypothetical protein